MSFELYNILCIVKAENKVSFNTINIIGSRKPK